MPQPLKPARAFIRQILGQVRPVTDVGKYLLVGLRKGAAESPELLDSLEDRLSDLPSVESAWFIPQLDRVVIRRENEENTDAAAKAILDCITAVEEDFGKGGSRFPTKSALPDLKTELPRLYMEMGLDLAGFSSGLILRRVGQRPYHFFSELSALNLLIEYTPQMRRPLDVWMGQANTELLLRTVATVSESFSQGWSGSLVDLTQRALQWQSETARARCWRSMSEDILASITRLSTAVRPGPTRVQPIPPGPIEDYQSTAEKLSLAAFSTGMAFTHDLKRSAATLFSALPRPALQGQSAFRLRLIQELAENGVLVLDRDVVGYLDRTDRIIVDARLVSAGRAVTTARYPNAKSPLALDALDDLLANCPQEHGTRKPAEAKEERHSGYSLVRPASTREIPAPIRKWWQSSDEPLEALRLIKQNGKVFDAALVDHVTDHTVEHLLSRARAGGLKVSVVDADESKVAKQIRRYQARGETLLALGPPNLLRHADIAVGVLENATSWPSGAHMVTTAPLDTLWRLLNGIELARTAARQSVQLAKIDAFSGLILGLEPMNRNLMSRIRLAANVASFAALFNGYRLARRNSGLPAELLDDPTPWHAMDRALVVERLALKKSMLPFQPEPPDHSTPSLLSFWLEEMQNPLVPVLMAGTGLAALTGAVGDAVLISAVVGMNGLVGGLQRRKTERQLKALGMTEDTSVSIMRDGEHLSVSEEELRPGDEISLRPGDTIPADARILAAENLEVDESSLTGESFPVAKSPTPTHSVNLAERHSMLYEGTTIVQGQAEAVVVAAKARSEANRAHYISDQKATGVEARLDKLTQMTVPVAAFSGLALLLNGLARQRPVPEVVSSGISLTVAAVPEGLPILATLSQLAAAGRLSEHGALARNPRAVEALGRMTVLCADKTGTLTEGKLALRYITVAGDIHPADSMAESARDVLLVSTLASPENSNGRESTIHGTDQALSTAVVDHAPDITREVSEWTRIEEMPFKSERGFHAALFQQGRRKRVCVKGAPEVILKRCNRWQREDGSVASMDADRRAEFEAQAHDLAARGLRILAVAERPARSLTLNDEKVARLIFRGFIALADPVRGSARASVDKLRDAGIRVKMITGDHPETAAAIGRELGLNGDASVLTGAEIDTMSDQKLAEAVQNVSIFARVTPAQKARLVKGLQDAGEVVGMTGDGANDAAAIRLADVGIALGRTSSQSAQQAADLLVLDTRIEAIVSAVQEGRALWSSVRDAVSLLVGGNLGEIGFNLVAGLLEGRPPLNARQLLLINLLTDTFPALAVALRKPKNLKSGRLLAEGPESALGHSLTREIQWRAGLTTGVATGTWTLARWLIGPERAATVGMLTVIGGQLAQTVNAGDASRNVIVTSAASMAALGLVVQTPGLSRVFGCARPGIVGWSLVSGALVVSFVSSRYLTVVEQSSEQLEKQLKDDIKRWITRDD